MLVKIIISTYMPTERPSKEANILIFREIPEKTGGKIRLRYWGVFWALEREGQEQNLGIYKLNRLLAFRGRSTDICHKICVAASYQPEYTPVYPP